MKELQQIREALEFVADEDNFFTTDEVFIDTVDGCHSFIEEAKQALTALDALEKRLGSDELVEELASIIRIQDINPQDKLVDPHEYLCGSRQLAEASIKFIRGDNNA